MERALDRVTSIKVIERIEDRKQQGSLVFKDAVKRVCYLQNGRN